MVQEYTEVVQEAVKGNKVIAKGIKLRDKVGKVPKNGEIASHVNNKRKL